MNHLWSVICELSPDEARRKFAGALLGRKPFAVDVEAAKGEFARARAILLEMREIEAWAALLRQGRAWARLLDVHDPVAAQLLSLAAKRAHGTDAATVDSAFRRELAGITLRPPRRGPKRDRLPNYLADNVVLAHRWLTGEAPPAGDPYDSEPVANSAFYRLGEAAFREHGLLWHASRLRKAIRRAPD